MVLVVVFTFFLVGGPTICTRVAATFVFLASYLHCQKLRGANPAASTQPLQVPPTPGVHQWSELTAENLPANWCWATQGSPVGSIQLTFSPLLWSPQGLVALDHRVDFFQTTGSAASQVALDMDTWDPLIARCRSRQVPGTWTSLAPISLPENHLRTQGRSAGQWEALCLLVLLGRMDVAWNPSALQASSQCLKVHRQELPNLQGTIFLPVPDFQDQFLGLSELSHLSLRPHPPLSVWLQSPHLAEFPSSAGPLQSCGLPPCWQFLRCRWGPGLPLALLPAGGWLDLDT